MRRVTGPLPGVLRWGSQGGGVAPYVGTKAASLDGVDEYLTGGTPTVVSSGWSFTAWVKRNDAAGNETYVGRRTNTSAWWSIYTTGAGAVVATWRNTTSLVATTAGSLVSAGVWAHIAVTFDLNGSNRRIRIWVNGTLAQTATDAVTPANISGTINFGRDPAPGTYWNGCLCDLYLWNQSLSDANVTAMYNGGTRGNPQTLSGLTATAGWPFQATDDMTGTTGSIASIVGGGTAATPLNTESGDLVAGP